MKTYLFFLAVSFSQISSAQDSLYLKDSLTVEKAIATALQNNYDIILSRNDSAVAALDYAYRDYAFLPRVNANTGYLLNHNAQNITLADGTKRNRNGIKASNLNASVGLNWVVFDGFKMFVTREKAEEFLRLGSLLTRRQVNNTVADVIKNYYNIVRQKQQLKTIIEQMSINEDRYKLAKYRLDIGVGVKPDVLQAQIDLNAQKAAQLNQLTLIEQLKQNLNHLMNVRADTRYEVSDSIPIQLNLTLGEIVESLEETNTELQVTRKNIDLAGLAVKERKAERFPTVALASAYNFTRANNNSVVNPTQPLFSQNRGLNYGISASIPIFNGLNTRRLIQQAELSVNYQKSLYENQKSLITTDLYNAFKTFDLQKQSLVLEESNIDLVKENLFIARERYRLAATTFLELREAQRSLEEAYNRLITARYNMKVAETEIQRLRGAFVQ
ncbi:MAG: TolC family protein [Chitinophagaceae bacterium]